MITIRFIFCYLCIKKVLYFGLKSFIFCYLCTVPVPYRYRVVAMQGREMLYLFVLKLALTSGGWWSGGGGGGFGNACNQLRAQR
jgi:hypothetical protein